MQRRFTTITDVTNAIFGADPGLEDALTEDQVREIVRTHWDGRYEDITDEAFAEMLVAAYDADGADEAQARRIVG